MVLLNDVVDIFDLAEFNASIMFGFMLRVVAFDGSVAKFSLRRQVVTIRSYEINDIIFLRQNGKPTLRQNRITWVVGCPPRLHLASMWSIQYRLSGSDMTAEALTPEEAIRVACHLLDDGCEVCGIGTGALTHVIIKEDIDRIYALGSGPSRGTALG
jgi:hypothetical protein